MKRVLLGIWLVTIACLGNAQSPFSFGLNGGLDFNNNLRHFGLATDDNFDGVKPDYNVGLDVGLRLNDKARLRFEMKYVKMGLEWNNNTANLSAVDIQKTNLRMYNFDYNLRFDYKFLTVKKLDIFVSPALKLEKNMTDYEYSTRVNGQTVSSHTFKSVNQNSDYNKTLTAGALGMLFKYNLTSHWGITFTPEYTYFFKELYDNNSKTIQRFSTNLGVEWKL